MATYGIGGNGDEEKQVTHMPHVEAGAVTLFAESFGNVEDPPLLLVGGLTNQLLVFPVEFCEAFVDRGFFVIRMDNRDVGLSTKFPDGPEYTLSDMADDCVAVLQHFNLEKAHIFGVSMGGMIVQTLAIDHPEVVASLISYASTTGNRDVGQPSSEALEVLLLPEATTREEAISNGLACKRVWGTPDAWSEEEMAEYFGALWDRAQSPGVGRRQMAAIGASGNREADLAKLDVPTLVIHGSFDPLIPASGGVRTAEVIPGATYVEIENMGHDIPITELPHVVQLVTNHAAAAGGA